MNRVIQFTRFRFIAYAISLIIIVGGIGATLLFKGYNLGIDFKGGLSQQLQIAPVAFRVLNLSGQTVNFNITANELDIIKAGEKRVIERPENQTLTELAKAIEAIGGFKVLIPQGMEVNPSLLIALHNDIDPQKALVINYQPAPGVQPEVNIDDLRLILSSVFSNVSMQHVGDPAGQEFMIRIDPGQLDASAGEDVFEQISKSIIANIEKRYGEGTVIVKQQESLGPQLAQSFASGSIIAVIVALAFMLIYVAFRFGMNYAVAGVVALIHDALATIAFIGVFQVEVNTAVVAALLTIIGYSINDTIVIYDRIRENETLLKGKDLANIMDVSVTQTLGRTFITSLTVFVAIFPLYLFGSGPVKDFSFAMIFGIIVGSYSSVFIASPIALAWQNALNRGKRTKEMQMFGKVQTPELQAPSDGQGEKKEPIIDEASPLLSAGTGPVTRIQRVLEKKKKKKRHL